MDGNRSMLYRSEGPCPDSEVLAAYLDGGLSEAERRQVAEHLSGCADCYEVFSESVRSLDEEESADKGSDPVAPVRRGPWQRLVRVAVPLAAVLVVAVGAGVALRWLQSPWYALSKGSAPEVVASLDAGALPEGRLSALVADHDWPKLRGGAGSGETGVDDLFEQVDATTSFQLGALSVDLALALKAGDAELVRNARQAFAQLPRNRLSSVVEYALVSVLPGEAGTSEGLDARRDAGASPAELSKEWEAVEASLLGLVDEPSYRFGRWAEAGRLAAAAGDLRYLDRIASAGAAAAIDDLPVSEVVADPVARELDTILSHARDGVGSDDLAPLEKSFAAIVRVGGGGLESAASGP